MRNIMAIIIVLVVSFVFVANNAEAARRHNNKQTVCTCPMGTMQRGCPVHGNDCLGVQPHEHENTKNRRADLPTFCTVNDQNFLVNEPTCKRVRQQIRDHKRAVREQIRDQQRMTRQIQRGIGNLPVVSDFQKEIQRENNRVIRDARNQIRRDIRNTVRGWYGR